MYKILYAQKANDDLTEIFLYIKNELKNSTAAYKFLESFFQELKLSLFFPYGSSEYYSNEQLKKKYYRIRIKNYLVLYIINEKDKIITIVRVIYQKRDINNIIK